MSGIYEVNRLLPTRAVFHDLDLRAFTKQLLDLTRDRKRSSFREKGTVTLHSILCGRYHFLEIKLNVV
jgi:hypothetical protein